MIIFSNDHLIGIKEIDDQHRKLFEIVGEIYNDIIKHEARSLDKYLIDLVAYSTYHSKTENKHLLNLATDDNIDIVKKHIDEHDEFGDFLMSQIETYSLNRDTVTTPILVNIAVFLNKWINNHIMIHDKRIFDILNRNKNVH